MMTEITLTQDQQRGLNTILKFIDDPTARTLVVKGYAGTGKSTLIQHAVKELRGRFRIAFSAPTNKATKVLREMALDAGISVEAVSTIYKLMGLVLKADGEVKEIGRGRDSSLAEFDIVVIDEGSMINANLMNYLLSELRMARVKLILMGDPLQLPPIGEEKSDSFDGCDYEVELTEIVRQAADNPIIQLTANIRQSILEERQTFEYESAKSDNGHGVYVLPKQKWEQWMRAGFTSKAYQGDGDAFRAVAWRNVTVNYLNHRIREAIYKEHAGERFITGERVINASPIMDELGEEVLVSTDSEGVIRDVEICNHPAHEYTGMGKFKVYHLSIGYEEAGLVDAFVAHEDAEKAIDRKLGKLSTEANKDRKLWPTFWAFKDSFNDIRPAHAITSHRSQGSTYDNVFVDVGDIRRNLNWVESMKSLYVSCSRARSNLMLLL